MQGNSRQAIGLAGRKGNKMDNSGWVKIHRKIWENPWMQRPNIMTVWMYILCHVEFAPKDVIWCSKRITLLPGQGLLTTTDVANECFIHHSTVIRILRVLEEEGQIQRKTSNKGTLVTVLNWEKYQAKEEYLHNTLHSTCTADCTTNCTTAAQRLHNEEALPEQDCAMDRISPAQQLHSTVHNGCTTAAQRLHNLPIIKEFKEFKELKKEKAEQKEKSKTATDVFSETGKEAFDFWQQNLGLPSPLLATKIQDLAEDTGLSAFKRAIEIAIERNRKNFAYIKAVAKGIQENGEFDGRKGKDRIQHDADSDFVTRKMLESGNVF